LRAGLLKCESVKIAAISRNNIVSFDAHGSSVRPLAGAFFFGERVFMAAKTGARPFCF